MLKTNTKAARANIRAYIRDNYTPDNYSGYTSPEPPTDLAEFAEIARFILDTFRREKLPNANARRYYRTEYDAFADWCAGLPSVLDTCYFYSRSAVDDLAALLDETPEERARFSEAEAEEMLTRLIYRELLNA